VIYSGFWAGVASAMLCLGAAVAVELISPKTRYTLSERVFGVACCLIGTVIASLVIPPLAYTWKRLGVPPLLHLTIGYFWAIVAAIVMTDFLCYWRHRVLHRVLWRIHAVHHSVTELHAANSYGHFLEFVANFVIVLIPMSLIDFGGVEVPVAALLVLSVLQLYIHSPVTIQFPRLRWFLVDSRYHRLHHSLEERHFEKNFGITFTIWDRLFGTAYFPAEDEWPSTGVTGIAPPESIVDFVLFPLSTRFEADGADRQPVEQAR
jgi:sterol desaturase/sphingolipid hydroxylase (fatty acid hydroxylase superfamily)